MSKHIITGHLTEREREGGGRQTDRQTDRYTDKHTDTQTDTHRDRDTESTCL